MDTQAAARIARRFITLPLEKRTLYLQKMLEEGVSPANLPIPEVQSAFEALPLSFAQERQWVLWQLAPESAAYNLPTALRLRGPLDADVLELSFNRLTERHQSLRTTFEDHGDGPRQIIHPRLPVVIRRCQATPTPDSHQQDLAIKAFVEDQAHQPFDLQHGPLLRVALLQIDETDHVLVLTQHHIVSDGWSMQVMVGELVSLYNALRQGRESNLPALPIQYADYAIWQRHWMEAGESERQLGYWKTLLGGHQPVLELPTDRPRPAVLSQRGATLDLSVPAPLAAALKAFAQQHEVTLFMLLLASFQGLLHHYSRQTEIRVGVPVANRNRVETERLLGFFVNTQVLQARIDPARGFLDLLQQVRQHVLDAQAHQDLPFEQLVEALQPERNLSISPLFQVMFNHLREQTGNVATASVAEDVLQIDRLTWDNRTTQFDLVLNTFESDQGLSASLTYATDLFDAASIARLGKHWLHLLNACLEAPQQAIASLPLLEAPERQRILQDWNATATPYPLDEGIHQWIERQVARSPQHTALVFAGQSLSYAALNARANQLAHQLIARGVGPDVLVGIAAERSLEMVVGLLGVLKAGGAYVPLDPEYPQERLDYMMQDSGIALLLTQAALLQRLPVPAGVQTLCLDVADGSHWPEHNPNVALQPAHLAYVIYTSGSTGKPKGAANHHRALLNRLCWMQDAYALTADDTVLQKTPFSFDVSVWEFFWPLMVGARLAIAGPGEHRDPVRLVELIEQHAVTTLHFVPSMLQVFLAEEQVVRCTAITRLICSGEALSVDAQQQVFGKLPSAALYNLYGPTEAAIDVTHWTCRDEGRSSVPIGLPIANLTTWVLNAELAPVPPGVIGELYLGGIGLARGYHRRPALTAERFTANPYVPGERLYRTGDLARQRNDGVIEYAGRIDHQVKIRGLRIELGEIEARLLEQDEVHEAAVIAMHTATGQQLVGYVVAPGAPSAEQQGPLRDALRQRLKAVLPEYMVPLYWVFLDALPLSPNGKLERRELPSPDASQAQKCYVAPATALQQRLAGIWQDVLKVERIGLSDNFFELGGDSIISIQVVSRARKAGIHFSAQQLFLHQTIEGLAAIAQVDAQAEAGTHVALSARQQAALQHAEIVQQYSLLPTRPLDPVVLEAALRSVVEHHEGLRLSIDASRTQGYLRSIAEQRAHWQHRPALTLQDSAPDDGALRAALIGHADEQRLLLELAGWAADAHALPILLEDLQTAYAQLERQQPVELPAVSAPRGQCAAAPSSTPASAPREPARRHLRLSPAQTRALLGEARRAYRTPAQTLLGIALVRAFAATSGLASVVLRTSDRSAFEGFDLSRSIGCFDNDRLSQLFLQDDLPSCIQALKHALRAAPAQGLQATVGLEYLPALEDCPGALLRHAADSPLSSTPAHTAAEIELSAQVQHGVLHLNWEHADASRQQALDQVIEHFLLQLDALLVHCCDPATSQLLAADFPLATLSDAQLRTLAVPARQVEDLYALSPMQQGMLFHSLEASEEAVYINQTAVHVSGLDIDRFVQAWQTVIQRHDILRIGFWTANHLSEPLQLVFSEATLPVHILDWQDRPNHEQALQELVRADARQGFDLLAPPLMRLTLVKLDSQRQYLIWTSHHILLDGWSTSQLLAEVFKVYNGHALPARRGQFRDYIGWLQAQSQDTLKQFWEQKLSELDDPTLLAGNLWPRPENGLDGHQALYLNWPVQQTSRLRDSAQRLRVTPNTLIQAAWLLLLQRFTGQDSVCFGATVAGRPPSLAGADQMLGLFINTLPIIQRPQPQQSVAEWLLALQAYNLEVRDHEHASLADLQRWYGQGGQALFDSIIVFENYPVDERLHEAEQDQLKFGAASGQGLTNFAMDLAVNLGERLSVEFMYLRNQFSEAAVEQIRQSFETLLLAIIDQPQALIGNLGTLRAEHQQGLPVRLAAHRDPQPLLSEQIRAHGLGQPEALAVVCGERTLSFGQLEQQANALAGQLIERGVGPETRVGVALERSVETIVAFYAVMKTGAAYVPLDIDYPQERLDWIIEDAALTLLLSHSALRQRFVTQGPLARVELDTLALDSPVAHPVQLTVDADNLAYLIYTSGSTGKPKGVAVSHGQIRMHCEAITQRYEMDTRTRELLFMSFAFDGAQERWLSTVSRGGRLVIRDNRLWTPEETWHALHQHGITIACFPPAYLQQLAEFARDCGLPPPAVDIYCFGGDAVAQANFELVRQTLKPRYLTNGYGPTETVVTPLLWKADASARCEAAYAPIGTAVGARALYLLDEHLNPVPNGVAGELYIGGEGVARGYHQRPGLTAERFVPDPYSAAGARLYRSGDLVRRRPDALHDYLGRLDNQVKIRGFRIELGEIEARLRDCAGVQDAVVIARDINGSKQLIGYVVGDSVTGERLRNQLQAQIPDYMVPAQIMLLPALPLNPNGKVDRKALPEPNVQSRPFVAPRNPLEAQLVAIWQAVLEVEQVSVTDNFFELGGDSLRVLKVLSKVRNQPELGLDLKLRDLMGKPTIAELSGYTPATKLDPLLLLNSRVHDSPPLFCLHAGFGTVFDYEPLARSLEGQRSVYGLQCRMLLDRQWQDESLAAMAIDYAQYIRQKQPQGPYHLLGWSLGGTLAVLVAQELEHQGHEVALLALVDSFVPADSAAPLAEAWGDDLRGFLEVIFADAQAPLPALELPANSSRQQLESLIESARASCSNHCAFAQISVEELAHTFLVAMQLKALSLQQGALPATVAQAHCWWACEQQRAAFERPIAGSQQDQQIVAGHYQILGNPHFLRAVLPLLQRAPASTY
ncbi:Linear gramicidin synthase subunit D [compost metagenome]